MDFNTMLQSDVSYNRPVEQPSMMAGLANILSSAMDTGPQREPSKDEKFTMILQSYQENNPALRSTDAAIRTKAIRDLTPEFLVNNPGFVSEYKSWSETLGAGIEVTFEDTAKDAEAEATKSFLQTPKGQLAAVEAEAAANKDGVYRPEIYEKVITNSRLDAAATKVKLDQITNNTAATAAQADTAKQYYTATEVEAEKIVALSMISMQDTLERALNGESVDLPPDLAARLGVKQINNINIYPVMVAARPFLVGQINDQLLGSFLESGADPSIFAAGPPEDVVKGWMAGYDIMLESVKTQSGDPSATLKTVTDGNTLNAYMSLTDDQRATTAILGVLQPEIRALAAQKLFDGSFSNDKIDELIARVTLNTISDRPVQDIVTDITDGSLTDAKGTLDTSMAMLGSGKLEGTQFTQTLTTALAANARTQSNASLGKDTFETLFVKNAEHIKVQAAADPEFSSYISGEVLSDINKTLEAAKISGVSSQLDVSIVNGKVVVELSESAKVGYGLAGGMGGGGAVVAPPIENLYTPEIKTLQLKLNSLEQLGDVGKEVFSAFNIGQTEPDRTIQYKLPEEVAADTEFLGKVTQLSKDQGIKPEDILRVIDFESAQTWNPAVKNPNSSATGLIQFMASTAKGLGTTTNALSKMSRAKQMDYVAKYLEPYKGKLKNFGDVYMAVHWPKAIGKDETYVMYEDGSKEYAANKNLDTNKDGTVTRGETIASVISRTGSGKGATAFTQKAADFATIASIDTATAMPPSQGSTTPVTAPTVTAIKSTPQVDTMPTIEPSVTQTATSTTPTVSKEAQALIASLGTPDATFTTNEEFLAASAAGKFTAGDVILVDGVTYVIRKDGTPVRVGGQ